ncbi:hypothetical protein GON26_05590 [Flavobacterium sp. GA093]|uniref:Uncharacterized protein n=1 Tax=Flavobacterium hydrocarbonoxydans TaxID=2683249 RepID=A0A6I4NRR1_9FLAO|nr:hypothetical protein [Flavobacterium hydrocarbonoxydans]MWB93824.1 hypothetical protein [Flavobacterium hydrocarbonoxydans]
MKYVSKSKKLKYGAKNVVKSIIGFLTSPFIKGIKKIMAAIILKKLAPKKAKPV